MQVLTYQECKKIGEKNIEGYYDMIPLRPIIRCVHCNKPTKRYKAKRFMCIRCDYQYYIWWIFQHNKNVLPFKTVNSQGNINVFLKENPTALVTEYKVLDVHQLEKK